MHFFKSIKSYSYYVVLQNCALKILIESFCPTKHYLDLLIMNLKSISICHIYNKT